MNILTGARIPRIPLYICKKPIGHIPRIITILLLQDREDSSPFSDPEWYDLIHKSAKLNDRMQLANESYAEFIWLRRAKGSASVKFYGWQDPETSSG